MYQCDKASLMTRNSINQKRKIEKNSRLFILVTLELFFGIQLVAGQTAVTTIDPAIIINPSTRQLLGVTIDARSGMMGTAGPVGYFDAAGNLISNIDTLFDDFPLCGVRYPGNGVGTGFNWKESIGDLPRPNQDVLGGLGSPQSIDFGFDEFMTYCESKGLTGEDVQIMVSIYDEAVSYNPTQNLQRVPSPASHAADWVEYANAPQGVNWGGGIEWSEQRVLNGHPEPYGIRTWNIGNEPWGPFEMAFDSSLYFPLATPIIDSMLARDPSIHITIPTYGNAINDWNYMIRKYAVSHGGIYGISPHCFQTMQNVNQVETMWKVLIDSAENANLKVIAGDFSFSIPQTGATEADKNRAMSWEGSLFATDMLIMCSQLNTIERMNHWIFGMTVSVWRPIREELDGSYTMLPLGNLYEILEPYFKDKSIQTICTSPASADGIPYSLRAGGFSNSTGDTLHVVALNRDTVSTLTYSINGLGNHQIYSAILLTSDSLTGEKIYSNPISPDLNGDFILPPMSVLLIHASSNVLGVNNSQLNMNITLFPNPTSSVFKILCDAELKDGNMNIYNQTGQIVYSIEKLNGNYFEFDLNLASGIYEIVLESANSKISKKLIIN